jgi:hypothetical protein
MRTVRSTRRTRRLATTLSVAALTACAALGTATSASAEVRGLDLQVAGCDHQAPGTTIALRANNVYGWKCFTGMYYLGISINEACRYTYGTYSSAYYLNYWDPYSWRCR